MKKVIAIMVLCCSCCFGYDFGTDIGSRYYSPPTPPTPPVYIGDRVLDDLNARAYNRSVENYNYDMQRYNQQKMRDMQKQIDDLKRQQQSYNYRY